MQGFAVQFTSVDLSFLWMKGLTFLKHYNVAAWCFCCVFVHIALIRVKSLPNQSPRKICERFILKRMNERRYWSQSKCTSRTFCLFASPLCKQFKQANSTMFCIVQTERCLTLPPSHPRGAFVLFLNIYLVSHFNINTDSKHTDQSIHQYAT